MPKYIVTMEALIEARDTVEAARVQQRLDALLANPALRMLLQAENIVLKGHRVVGAPKPTT